MPIYEYHCPRCEKNKDAWRKVADRDNPPDCCGWPTRRIMSPTRGAVDIKPYWTVAHDKETNRPEYIKSRRQHRDFVKRNGYEEVGSESTIPKDAQARIEEKRYIQHELDDSVDALP